MIMLEYGLLGENLSHSYSPMIHSMLGDYRYELLPCPREEMRALLTARDFLGMNVTIPYKKDAFTLCDELSSDAQLLGNVNTVLVSKDKRLLGYNTDLHGFLSMVSASGIEMRGRKIAILGTGGSGHTARMAAESLGAKEVLCVSRAVSDMENTVTYERLHRDHPDVEVIVNATPVGMYPRYAEYAGYAGDSPVDISAFPNLRGVLDLIYNPYRTALILDAQDRGIPCRSGLWMLIAQVRRGAELFLGKAIPELKIKEIHAHIRSITENGSSSRTSSHPWPPASFSARCSPTRLASSTRS